MPLPEGLQDMESSSGGSSGSLPTERRRSRAPSRTPAARSTSPASMNCSEQAREAGERASSYKRGGTMRKTKANRGMAKLHRGEDIMAPRKKKSRMRGRRGGR